MLQTPRSLTRPTLAGIVLLETLPILLRFARQHTTRLSTAECRIYISVAALVFFPPPVARPTTCSLSLIHVSV
ncbi:hypothetical protein C8R46DRAFT_293118 [Mycena filopes]|nr:hypothetical protein C8R46DRAFT_293118 [Mycena filopes]